MSATPSPGAWLKVGDLPLEPLAPAVDGGGGVSSALYVIDLDSEVVTDGRVLDVLTDRTAVVVGVATRPLDSRARVIAAALDLTLTSAGNESDRCAIVVDDPVAAVDVLGEAISASPRAALVLAAVLRQTCQLPVAEGLAAEAAAYSTLLAGPEFARWLRSRGAPRPAAGEDARDRVLVRRHGDVLEVQLSRPWRRNALDAAMRVALLEALTTASADPDTQVRISGAGPVFCAGGDLDEFGSADDPATAWVVRTAEAPGRLVARLGSRVEVQVHGACAGAGVELAAFASRVVADPATTFRLPELGMGLLPGAGGTVSLMRRIGRWRTLWLALSGHALDARTALEWRLVDELVPVAQAS